ncbi:methyl-accepting chemotaxis protein [Marinobacterium arenosum]|uniref:methyl-accepting chemotaxis protein n=1 Tax=Marinobacterium arenosum TaxID=2862496 RepID=UPI001C976879|nr:methyl-accepting chemotaxis protein [Marinobacterium arenosum]MBY4676641.1 methyl-accepting chemotaxis protein [Marinobacterium arenosum]
MKFSHKIVLSVSLLIVLTFGISMVNQNIRLTGSVTEQISGSVDEITSGIAGTVKAQLDSYKSQATLVTGMLSQTRDLEEMGRIIRQNELSRNFLMIGVGFEKDGSAVISDPSWARPASWDPRKRGWYSLARNSGTTDITAPYADAGTGEILISVAAPVMHDGRFVGATFFDVSLVGLAKVINSFKLMDAGYAFMVSADGTTISHPQAKFNGKPMDQYLPGLQVSDREQQLELDGKDYQIFFKQVEGMPWYVGVALDRGKTFALVDELNLDALLIALGAIAVSIIALMLILKKLMRPLHELEHALKDVASGDGDLTRRLSTDSDPEFAILAEHFNSFTDKLRGLINEVKHAGQEIKHSTERSSEGALASSQDMSNQLNELEMLAAAMNEMVASATQIAGNAQQAAEGVRSAEHSVTEGGDSLAHTTEAISHLSEHVDEAVNVVVNLETASENIESILAVINDIADQTNLLALNAAIEAARAGEQGRGFAVVADEVRTLAHRTTESTKEIRQMIEQLQQGTRSAVDTMNSSKEVVVGAVERAQRLVDSFDQIKQAMHKITEMNVQIASASEEQSLVCEEINRNAMKIKDICSQVSQRADGTNNQINDQLSHVKRQNDALSHFVV